MNCLIVSVLSFGFLVIASTLPLDLADVMFKSNYSPDQQNAKDGLPGHYAPAAAAAGAEHGNTLAPQLDEPGPPLLDSETTIAPPADESESESESAEESLSSDSGESESAEESLSSDSGESDETQETQESEEDESASSSSSSSSSSESYEIDYSGYYSEESDESYEFYGTKMEIKSTGQFNSNSNKKSESKLRNTAGGKIRKPKLSPRCHNSKKSGTKMIGCHPHQKQRLQRNRRANRIKTEL